MKYLSKLFALLMNCMLLIGLISANAMAQKIQANNPLPVEFVQKIDRIALRGDIKLLESTFLTSPTMYSAGVLVYKAKSVLNELEKEVAKDLPPEKDTLLLKEAAYKAFRKVMTENGSSKSESDFTLNITIIDHGFEWATSSAMGIYIRLKVVLLSSAGNMIWEQEYFMDKEEKKRPHNRGAMSARSAIRKLVTDYKSNPDLLPETYNLICEILASKFLPTKK